MQAALPIIDASDIGDIVDPNRPMFADTVQIDRAHQIQPPKHLRGQFIYASTGSLQISTSGPTFVVPAQFAVWIPPGITHNVTAAMPVEYCSLFLDPSISQKLADHAQLLHLTSLLKELTQTAACFDMSAIHGAEKRMHSVILDQLQFLQPAKIAVPIPTSQRLRKLVNMLLEHPENEGNLTYWAQQLAMSTRTLSRHFKRETGLSFGQWLQHIRVLKAFVYIEKGYSISATAYELGYKQPSAFIAMFRRITGQTPTHFIP